MRQQNLPMPFEIHHLYLRFSSMVIEQNDKIEDGIRSIKRAGVLPQNRESALREGRYLASSH